MTLLVHPTYLLLMFVWIPTLTLAQDSDDWKRWCGKHYEEGSPYDIPIGRFEYPKHSGEDLLNFQCWPSQVPFLFSDERGEFIVDAPLYHDVGVPFKSGVSSTFRVSITLEEGDQDGRERELGSLARVHVNSTGVSIPFDLSSLGQPRKDPYRVKCVAIFEDGSNYTSMTSVNYLPPNPYGGSASGIDMYTGSMIVYRTTTSHWEKIIPFGFYTSFDGFLAPNRTTLLPKIKDMGHNLVHPIPTFNSVDDLIAVIDLMEELDLWLMYDMRWSYQNLESVEEEVERVRGYPNLLLTYTADEPDGFQDPLDATMKAKELIEEIDGYHPVSLVLNCQNYYFGEYTNGADIILEDAYPVDLEWANYSSVYHTRCDENYGCCGCDNCIGSFTDISTRIDVYMERRRILSRTRSMSLWAVPQAFGGAEWWPRQPTGAEWLMMVILSLNHGAMGIVPWDHNGGTSEDILSASATFGHNLDILTPYLTNRDADRKVYNSGEVDIAVWKLEGRCLVMIANTGYSNVGWSVLLQVLHFRWAQPVFRDVDSTTLRLKGNRIYGHSGSVGSGAWVLS